MSDHAALLFANEAFYHAFRSRDPAAMERVWAARPSVTCIHPGWRVLHSREEVMASWQGILGNPEAPPIVCREARAHVHDSFGLVLCYEVIGESVLAATNAFLREGRDWRMIHHQAGPCELTPAQLAAPADPGPMQ